MIDNEPTYPVSRCVIATEPQPRHIYKQAMQCISNAAFWKIPGRVYFSLIYPAQFKSYCFRKQAIS